MSEEWIDFGDEKIDISKGDPTFREIYYLNKRIAETYHNGVIVFKIEGAAVAPEMMTIQTKPERVWQLPGINEEYHYGMIQLSQASIGWASKNGKNYVVAFGYKLGDELMGAHQIVELLEEQGCLEKYKK